MLRKRGGQVLQPFRFEGLAIYDDRGCALGNDVGITLWLPILEANLPFFIVLLVVGNAYAFPTNKIFGFAAQ